MVKNYYLDASAFVKRYFPEKGSEFVDWLFAEGDVLVTASLTYAEVYSAINRLYREGKFVKDKFASASIAFEADWVACAMIDFNQDVRKKIPEYLNRFPLRGSDGVHLVSALSAGEKGLDVCFVTSDGKLFNAVESCGLKAIDPTREKF